MQLTLRLRKPGIILLYGEKGACAAARAALERLGRRVTCDVWTMPGASQKLREAILDHQGEAWLCSTSPRHPARIVGPHGEALCGDFDAAVVQAMLHDIDAETGKCRRV